MPVTPFSSRYVEASDGLRLHARDYGRGDPAARTVVCLPGLARTAADFDALAVHLTRADPNRRVLVLDYRGRGLSDRDPDPSHYDLPNESDDILAVLVALGVASAVFVGTSRGGLHTMILAAVRPGLIAGVVLNDIGPVIEKVGLQRIRGYVGKLPQPASWPEAVALLKDVAGAQFTALAETDWTAYAQTTFEESEGRFLPRYDPALMQNLAKMDLDAVPTLWPQFDGLSAVPMMVIRGANSDLLAAATVEAMVARHPDCVSLIVPGQGHAPLLTDASTMDAIAGFVARCESHEVAAARSQRSVALLA